MSRLVPRSSSIKRKMVVRGSECRFENETIWLTQALIAELFHVTPQNVTIHLKALFEEGELDEVTTCKDYLQVRFEGGRQVSRKLRHYNLTAILAVGYRIRSPRGTQFRPISRYFLGLAEPNGLN